VTGSLPELGSWNYSKGLHLITTPSTFPIWQGQLEINQEGDLEYKYMIISSDKS
jgi:hypothetical protein